MNIKKPKFRCGTAKAINSLIDKFNLPYEDWMQDWPYEISDADKIDEYFNFYDQIVNEDEKFIFMELLIQATNDQSQTLNFNNYWPELKKRIINDFSVHEYTIHYWSCFDNENLEDCWTITPYMRELWIKQSYTSRKTN